MSGHHKQLTKFYHTDRQNMKWYLFDAKGKTLGRLASEITKVLRGKHKPTFTPNMDLGDGVIVINAQEVFVSGNKEAQKIYYSHSGFLGGLKEVPYRRMMERHPERVLELAIRRMMPKNRLSRAMLKKCRIFAGENHDMQAQQPIHVAI